ncbi:MAG: hypothetical protein FWD15_05735 [Alphaproteobacteria bacterium]|nr:hypothetical protein [Alphaproteobacteria bacterium]
MLIRARKILELNLRRIRRAYDDSCEYSRRVFILKFALPIVAGVFIALILILPHFSQIAKVRLSIPKLDGIENMNFTIKNSNIRGIGDDGSVFSARISQGIEAHMSPEVHFTEITGRFSRGKDRWFDVFATAGTFHKDKKVFHITGTAKITDSEGNTFITTNATVDAGTSRAFGNDPITAHTPFGDLVADGFNFIQGKEYVFFGRTNGRIEPDRFATPR